MIRGTRALFKAAAVVGESPRMTIAKNILAYNAMMESTTEAGLAEASKVGTLDVQNLPPQIAELQAYLSVPVVEAGAGFTPNPAAWQNKDFASMAVEEAGYTWFWPFLVGGAASAFLFGILPKMSLGEEGKKKSNYMKMMEGDHH